MSGHTSRKEWMQAYVTRLVREALGQMMVETNDIAMRDACRLLYYHGLHSRVGSDTTDYANARELQDIIDWKDRRKA